MRRRLLLIDPAAQCWRLETLRVEMLDKDPREEYLFLSGEPLCQYLLRRDEDALIIARGPMPFLAGNKTSVGYVSPLTGVPHYSFVGGRAAAQLLNLGLDAIVLIRTDRTGEALPKSSRLTNGGLDADRLQLVSTGSGNASPLPGQWTMEGATASESMGHSLGSQLQPPTIVIGGRAPNLTVDFRSAAGLPTGQRSAYYWLLERELDGDAYAGSIFAIGEGARRGYRSANLAVDAIYHAGRGGAGDVFARYAQALVLRGEPVGAAEFFAGAPSLAPAEEGEAFARNPNRAIASRLDEHCARLSGKSGGTIAKLYATGADPEGENTLPAQNARRLGYSLADLGSPRVLKATRQGQTGCHWCPVDCRHYHWVTADYAPGGRDMLLDDFEPAYAIFAMLGLEPDQDTFRARLDLLAEVDRRLILPIEQMGCDVMNVGLGLAALFEGIERGIIPAGDAPDSLTTGGLDAAAEAIAMLRSGQAAGYAALQTAGHGPQALADSYPPMQEIVFTGGRGTLGNAGHSNALWTFLMPFSRFFGHYVGQFYKVDEELPPPGSNEEAYRACFERVVERLLAREFFWLLSNALSLCAFTFVIFSQDGAGERLSDGGLLERLLRYYGIHTTRADLEWFAQAFWAQSIDLKAQFGWQPPSAADLPRRVYEALSLALGRTPEELESLMEMLIEEWKRQAREVMVRFGYGVTW